jgi:hypothetical protein
VTSVERVERKKRKRNRDQYNRRVVENPRNSSTHTLRKMKVMVRINLVVSSHIEEEERRKFFFFFYLFLLFFSPFFFYVILRSSTLMRLFDSRTKLVSPLCQRAPFVVAAEVVVV